MVQRVFVKVVGFSDDERHALNTVFRLSEQCRTMYQLWTPEAREPARLALLDADSHEARVEAAAPSNADLRILWVGANAPASAVRQFERPLAWPEVIATLDALFNPEAIDLDLDADAALTDSQPMSNKLALIVSPDRAERLYLRARLALARVTLADEAESGTQAVELARDRQYDVALVDCGLQDIDAWAVLRELRRGRRPIAHVALTQGSRSPRDRLRAWLAGADALLGKRPHPGRIDAFLSRI